MSLRPILAHVSEELLQDGHKGSSVQLVSAAAHA